MGLTPTLLFLGHGLALERIYPREAADTGLIQFDRRTGRRRSFIDRCQVAPRRFERRLHGGDEVGVVGVVGLACGQPWRSTIIFLISAMALAGLSPLGQVLEQFMMVWQRYSLNGSSSPSSRSVRA